MSILFLFIETEIIYFSLFTLSVVLSNSKSIVINASIDIREHEYSSK